MRVSFDIDSVDDAEAASGQCAAIADAWRLMADPNCFSQVVEVTPTTAAEIAPARSRRGRPRKSEDPVAADPVAATVTADPVAATRNEDLVAADPVIVAPEDAREKLRNLAREKGVTWLRPLLVAHGAARLGDLTDTQVNEVLRDAA